MNRLIYRRQFVIAGSFSLALLKGCLPEAKDSSARLPDIGAEALDFGPYQIGVQTYCFHDLDFEDLLVPVQALGLRKVELFEDHLPVESPDEALTQFGRKLEEAKITPVGFYTHAFDRGLEPRQVFDFAKQMGIQYINGEHRQESLSVLNELTVEYGIQVAIHNHGPGTRYDKLADVQQVLEQFNHLVTCIDIGHYARSGVNPARAIRAIGSRAVALHVKDIRQNHENTVVGTGIIDMQDVFVALRETGFDGLLVLEYEGDMDNLKARLRGMLESLKNMSRFIKEA